MSEGVKKSVRDMIRGDRIRYIRDRSMLSQDEAASRMNISRQALSSIENGGDFHVSTLKNMMETYGVTANAIMSDISCDSEATADLIDKINMEMGALDLTTLKYLYISLHSINQLKSEVHYDS